MHVLSVTDRLSMRGGADLHLRDVLSAAARTGMQVTLAVGRVEQGAQPPSGVRVTVVRGLSRMVADTRRLGRLQALLRAADVVHAQNVMNPVALAQIAQTGRAIFTVQDHRMFCPGPGKTLPLGDPCTVRMSAQDCARCLQEPAYRDRLLQLTRDRLSAIQGARIVVLSRYMADELALAGLDSAVVIPPWVPVEDAPTVPGDVFVMGGRLVSHKNSLRGWQAWQDAGAPLPLVIAGEGPLLGELHDTQQPGWLSRDVLRALLTRARALLFPARWQEPFGILGAEALACGTPVILTPRGGMGDWARAGCIAADSDDAIRAAICHLARAPQHAADLGAAGKAMIQEHFSEARLSDRLWALYDEVRCSA